MMLYHALCFFLLHIFLRIPTTTSAASAAATAAAPPAYNATDFILLNCGASSNSNDTSGRTWDGDDGSSYVPGDAASISSASTASNMHPSVFQAPYQTARVFRSPFWYTFPLRAGPKFLRLYLYPTIYPDFNASQSLFTVKANAFTLLSNFSAFLFSKNSSQPSFMKEFIINIVENQLLYLTFTPNPNSSAFINGIEIVSIPDKLYFRGKDVPIKYVDQLFYLDDHATLENYYRLNVGGSRVEIQDDSGPTRGMFRAWNPDDDYIISSYLRPHAENVQINYTAATPPYSAPAIVYTTCRVLANDSRSLDWEFPVDSGFYYLLRLHFCEIQLEVTRQNERVFTISINNQAVEIQADVIYWTGGNQIPIFKDYITWVPDDGRRGKRDLRLSLFPNMEGNPRYSSALLNGIEIFKLNDSNWSLAAGKPDTGMDSLPPGKKKNERSTVIYAVIGSVIGALVVAAASFLIFQQQRKVKDSATTTAAKLRSTTTTTGSGVSLPSVLCRCFSLDEIQTATFKFNDNFVIGKGGFGNVYKGLVDNGTTTVAIKRLNRLSKQGAREFLTEIEMLSKLRHRHLVSLVGYCDEGGEMILVYDYMANGTLHDQLYNSEKSPSTWKQRLQICLGAAKGLHYLHTGVNHTIIHRDVKSTNILLDEKWVAKISDFGLSKMEPPNDSVTHISTNVKGTFGYLDPQYFSTSKLTRKSDVYAFGVVLFEVLSGRPAVDIRLEEEQHSLAQWARYCMEEGKVDQLIDHNLLGQISPACLQVFVGIAGRCLNTQPQRRPEMADVVMGLELALALQQSTDPKEQVEEEENAVSDQSDGVISMDDITPTDKGESESIISEDYPSTSTSIRGSDQKNGKMKAKDDSVDSQKCTTDFFNLNT